MKEIKTVGVACDNYKEDYFKKKLRKQGYLIKDVVKFSEEVKIIQVHVPADEMQKFARLIKRIEFSFKTRN